MVSKTYSNWVKAAAAAFDLYERHKDDDQARLWYENMCGCVFNALRASENFRTVLEVMMDVLEYRHENA